MEHACDFSTICIILPKLSKFINAIWSYNAPSWPRFLGGTQCMWCATFRTCATFHDRITSTVPKMTCRLS